MEYKQTLEFLFSQLPMFQRQGAAAYKANLDNTHAFCAHLGNPERCFPSVHIAGTNGKGSVSHFIASYLQESDLKIGLYTSPHLKSFRERIRVNGEMISEQYVVDFVAKHMDFIKELRPSFFEITFAMAIQYFADNEVDFAVMETGMGGRLDSTNVVDSKICAITNISKDHAQFLGDTIQKIAGEKAGIIKPHIPVVIGRRQAEVEDVFKAKAKAEKAPIFFADDRVEIIESSYKNHQLHLLARDKSMVSKKMNLESPLAGKYQINNIRTFMALVSVMEQMSLVDFESKRVERAVKNVIKNTKMMGRWQILNEAPLTIADTGHNFDGLTSLFDQIASLDYKKLHFVLGVVNDKELDGLLDLFPKEAEYYFCKADIPRALEAEVLAEKARSLGMKGEIYGSVMEAFEMAKQNAEREDLVFVGGSTFVVAEILPE